MSKEMKTFIASAGQAFRRGVAAGRDIRQRNTERGGQCGDREERGGRDAAGLDLAERLGRHAGKGRYLGHAATTPSLAEQRAEPLAAEALLRTQGCADHSGMIIPVLLSRQIATAD